jgi:hypothetical protein
VLGQAFLMPWQLYTAIVFCLKAGDVEDDFTDSSSVSKPAVPTCAPTALSDEPGVRYNAWSTVRDKLPPFL